MYAEFIARPLVLGLTHAISATMATVAQIVNICAHSATTRINALLPVWMVVYLLVPCFTQSYRYMRTTMSSWILQVHRRVLKLHRWISWSQLRTYLSFRLLRPQLWNRLFVFGFIVSPLLILLSSHIVRIITLMRLANLLKVSCRHLRSKLCRRYLHKDQHVQLLCRWVQRN